MGVMTLDALPPGEWTKDKHGVKRFRPAPDLTRMRQLQEQTILHILLETRRREREALDRLMCILRRKKSRKDA